MTSPKLDQLCINTIRFLAVDTVQQANSGQLHKGGPGSGLFLQLTAEHAQDVTIPEAPYSFGVLADGQAVGDLQALRASERRAVRVDLGSDPAVGIRRMADEVV